MKKANDMSLKELIKGVKSNETIVDSRVVEGEDIKEDLKKHVDTLNFTEIVLLNDYFAGKAVITYKSVAQAEEAMNEWIMRMGTKLCIDYERMLDDPKVKDKERIAIMKELLLRVSPPTQEIIIDNKNKGKTDHTLLLDAQKIVVGISKSFKKIGVQDVT